MTAAVFYLCLGVVLITFPAAIVEALGLPDSDRAFYPSVLGGVLIGIGLAFWMQVRNTAVISRGLGVLGAVIINISGGTVLAAWLVFGDLEIPLRGVIVLMLSGSCCHGG